MSLALGISEKSCPSYAELPAASFTTVYDIDRSRAEKIAKQFGVRAATSLQDFAEQVDAASVATTTSAHFEVGYDLLGRGKHLLVEKPIAENPAHATELAELAARQNLVLQVGHVERFNPVLSALEARLTHPRFIEAHRLSAYPHRSTDIGVVLDLMIHDLEIFCISCDRRLRQSMPSVCRFESWGRYRERAPAFREWLRRQYHSSRISPESMRKIRVFQEKFISPSIIKIRAAKLSARKRQDCPGKVEIGREEPLKRQLAEFIECASTGRAPKVSGFQATAALELAVEITKRIETTRIS